MRGGTLLLIVALVIAYLGVTGKYKCFSRFLTCAMGGDDCGCQGGQAIGSLPRLAPLPSLRSFG